MVSKAQDNRVDSGSDHCSDTWKMRVRILSTEVIIRFENAYGAGDLSLPLSPTHHLGEIS